MNGIEDGEEIPLFIVLLIFSAITYFEVGIAVKNEKIIKLFAGIKREIVKFTKEL